MDQQIAVVEQNPFRVVVAFDARRPLPAMLQLLPDLVRDGLNLAGVGSAANHEIVGEGRDWAHIERNDVTSLLGFGGSDGG